MEALQFQTMVYIRARDCVEAVVDTSLGIPAIWEPFLLYFQGQIITYYSDQRDPLYGQKLVHQTSKDLVSWGPVVPDVEYSTYTSRPGMTTVTHLPNGKYMMTYEFGGGPDWGNVTDYEFPVYYRINDSPLNFNESVGYPVVANGVHPTSSPYVTWSSVGGPNGSILVSCGTLSQIFINNELGAVDAWKMASTPGSYFRTRHSGSRHVGTARHGFTPKACLGALRQCPLA